MNLFLKAWFTGYKSAEKLGKMSENNKLSAMHWSQFSSYTYSTLVLQKSISRRKCENSTEYFKEKKYTMS